MEEKVVIREVVFVPGVICKGLRNLFCWIISFLP